MIATHRTAGSSITLQEAAQFVAETTGARRPHINTVLRWARKGVRGVKLDAVRVGRTFWTTRHAVAAFLAKLNSTPETASSVVAAEVLQRQRAEHARQVHAALSAKLGIDSCDVEADAEAVGK